MRKQNPMNDVLDCRGGAAIAECERYGAVTRAILRMCEPCRSYETSVTAMERLAGSIFFWVPRSIERRQVDIWS
jgi:hypothetical protein